MNKKCIIFALTVATIPLSSCTTNHYAVQEEQMTVAKAQRGIKMGMSSAEVVEVLGAPNMVTTDSEHRETWVYDKVSTNMQASSGGLGGMLLGIGGSVGGLLGANYSSAQSSSNQRTLTIIVKFDTKGYVRDLAYRTSTF